MRAVRWSISRARDDDLVVSDKRVLGVDACKYGWVGIACAGGQVAGYAARTIIGLVDAVLADGPVEVIGVDMPIGLPDRGRRKADELATKEIGVLRSSVFMTPVRSALDACDHATASAHNRELTANGISVQAYGLRAKILEVDQWVRQAPCRVVEIHPEVSFAQLAGIPLDTRKHSWAGAQERRGLLAGAGITLPGDLGPAGRLAAVDDVLDAAVCAWSAQRVARGEARCRPDEPEIFSDGLPCAIWA